MSETVDRLNRALNGRYRVERELGVGGMATVYLAEDLRHGRRVAIKVLKADIAAHVGAERFLAEIRTTASLRHPHILPLFDSGEADGFLFYVMPHVEGETLRQRLDREGQLPVEEAVAIAVAVADGLQAAHEQGVVHRDIKPGNILLGRGGPLVADFGIALALGAGGEGRLTETGLSLGTPYYMSPEQAAGEGRIGPSSDVYALGCVLYEMLAGEPPFAGGTVQAVLGRILTGDPVHVTELRSTVPVHVDAAISRALERVPADRFTQAGSFGAALRDPAFRHTADSAHPTATARPGVWTIVPWALAITVGLLWALDRPDRGVGAPVIRYEMGMRPGQEVVYDDIGAFGPSLALSPDGARMAYVGVSDNEGYRIWVRERGVLDAMPLAGTEGGSQPFFSPDGERVAFMVRDTREIRVASLAGGPTFTLVDSVVIRLGGHWSEDGWVYYAALADGGLRRVRDTGGTPELVSIPDVNAGERYHAWPDVLPDGNGALVTLLRAENAYSPDDDVAVLDFETGEVTVLFHGLLGRYLPSGHVLFVDHDGGLFAAAFDPAALRIEGPVLPLESGLEARTRGPSLAVSRSGRIAYASNGSRGHELVWMSRQGEAEPTGDGWVFLPPPKTGVSLGPDGRRVAVSSYDVGGGTSIWVKEFGGALVRLALGGNNYAPSWSPDGRSVLYLTSRYDSDLAVVEAPADGSGSERVLVDVPELPIGEGYWSADGAWLLLRGDDAGHADVYGLRTGRDSVPVRLFGDPGFIEASPQLSPDGRWIAYTSDESNQVEVYVRPFPDVTSARYTVSTGGGIQPRWAHSGREIFYVTPDRELVSARVSDEGSFGVLSRDTLFALPPGMRTAADRTQYDLTADDARFLMFQDRSLVAPTIVVVENFVSELRARLGS